MLAAAGGDPAAAFYAAELDQRRLFGSPPFGRVVKLTVGLADRDAAEAEARRLAGRAAGTRRGERRATRSCSDRRRPTWRRRAGRWRFQLVLRGSDPAATLGGDPGAPWSVDVDPDSLL